MQATFTTPTDWTLEISPDKQAAVWDRDRASGNAWGRWNAYLDRLCLETILPWLQAEYLPTATAWVSSVQMPLVWDVVNGAVITVGAKRIALIPTEAIDRSALEVSQEWVDISSWAADYYIGVQVTSDGGSLAQPLGTRIEMYGYTTHQQLKTAGSYDPIDRTYCLDIEDLNPDLNALWLTIDRYTIAQTRAAIAPIPTLAAERVAPLIDRLSDPNESIPRLAVPFQLWAAIIDRPEWLQRLYQQRQTGANTPTIVRLSDWLQGRIETAWQTLDRVLLPQQIATAVRSGERTMPTQSDIYRAKTYSFATGEIALVIGISPLSDTESRIDLQIHPAGGATQLPGATSLRLLTIDGTEIGRASAAITETIQFQFRASAGEEFQIEIDCGGQTQTEQFVL